MENNILKTLWGDMEVAITANGICRLQFLPYLVGDKSTMPTVFMQEITKQLNAYFCGNMQKFSLPVDLLNTTPFMKSVYLTAMQIPFGSVCSYYDLAMLAGFPNAYRAVGSAMRKNPIAILIPCHRIVAKDGSMPVSKAGLQIKKRLLELEGIAFNEQDKVLL